jgi:hypothetical protein
MRPVRPLLLALVALAAVLLIVQQQRAQTVAGQVSFAAEQFKNSADADVKLSYLANICGLGAEEEARTLFFDQQTEDERQALFAQTNAEQAGDNLVTVVRCLQPAIPPNDHELREAIGCALGGVPPSADARRLKEQFGYTGACPTSKA